MFIVIITAIIAALLIGFIVINNSFRTTEVKVENQYSQIDIQLKKRFDLITNLVEVVKGYAKHEKQLFEEITNIRSNFNEAKDDKEKDKLNNALSGQITKLFAVAEAYPELKSDKNFLDLQQQLKKVEEDIGYARQFYNDAVMTYNNKVKVFPSSIIASIMGYKEKEFFQAKQEEKENVKIEL